MFSAFMWGEVKKSGVNLVKDGFLIIHKITLWLAPDCVNISFWVPQTQRDRIWMVSCTAVVEEDYLRDINYKPLTQIALILL